ncbi:PREDICTED: uncharacterized protein LOC108759373 [Trachymyrmex cornetzi]|uniref:SCL-interrupting locus protein like protein n=1 Tax=Trachymyrmex cornetzi TaxID=471704 RepID=A0A151JAH6_9HYME|nr:PREDICTED: uncharacterized protein LOC108759373 [Trachymyrmex cornetzi]KYN22080.1 hypothetical protein ALC57_05498 [Trachymyrmex cornetzi]
MYYQFYDGEEEVEPRVVPKPITKHDCFVVPTVPEISLIFEKPTARNSKNRSIDTTDSLSAISVRPIQIPDNTVKVSNSISSISHNSDSYATWKEQNYSREINSTSTTHISPLYKNTCSYDYAVPGTGLQNTSIQKLQEQTKINDKLQTLQNTSKNERIYEKSVKFTCSDIGDSYRLESQTDLLSLDKRALSSDSLQRAQLNIADRTMRTSNNTIPDTLKKPEYFQTPYTGCQQFHVPNYSNYNIDNNETVKTLLQLVNSQNQQIKNLQLQIDKLVRMQEENFRNKPTCLCSQPLANQVFRYPINYYDPTLASSLVQSQNQSIKKNVASQSTSVVERQDLENFSENNKLETTLLEQQSKKAFMEQKVSIGVMTSFEFTVQNSPFPTDSEICEKTEAHRESNSINSRANTVNTVNIHDTTEPVNRYKNTFTRKPGPAAQLENIVEDSESYLSSSQQQSSNFNASSSMKESSKLRQHLSTDLNQEETHKGAYIGKDSNVYERASNARKLSNTSMNVDCIGSANCSEALVVKPTNDFVTIDRKKCTYKTNINQHSLHNVHLPATDYYHNHRNKEHVRSANVRQIKDIGDDSMILSGGDLKILERPPPTPEPSIHVEMQEYVSDDESDKLRHTSKIGWTFYNNVLGQVNEILQNSGVISDEDLNHAKTPCNVEQENDRETRSATNTVKAATLEQLRRLGISLTENNEHRESNGNKTLDFDSSFYPRLDHQANMTHTTSAVNETNTSMHMKALALKYLSNEQLTDIAWHKQESSSLKHLMLSNMQGTNMSLATMRYLERYQLLPGKNNVQAENTNQACDRVSSKYDFKPAVTNNNPALRRFPFVQTSGTTCPSRILDLSALKRQPKLL